MKRLLFALSAAVILATSGQPLLVAQGVYQGGALDARQHGFKQGYRDGFAFGQNSQVSNRDQDIVNQRLRAADKDYQPAYGSQEQYRQGYAEGFRAGMEESRAGKRSRLEEMFRTRNPNNDPDRRREDRVYRRGALEAREHGFEHGYREGFAFGANARVSNREQDIVNQRLRAADKDFLPAFGSQELFRQGFEEGFRAGVEDSRGGRRSRLEELFRIGDPTYDPDNIREDRIAGIAPRSQWPARHLAADIGYRDGFISGMRDRQENRKFQPRRHTAWQNGMHGYDGEAPRGEYRSSYRAGYEAGYRDAFGRSR